MENFGNYLKNERESRGVPLEEIADNTKINMRFLLALESNDYNQLPGEVFIKGFIRSYAKTIGGDAEEILTIYDKSVGKEKAEQILPMGKTIERKQDHIKKIRWAFLVFGLILFVTLIFFGFQKFQETSPNTVSNPMVHGVSGLYSNKPQPMPSIKSDSKVSGKNEASS